MSLMSENFFFCLSARVENLSSIRRKSAPEDEKDDSYAKRLKMEEG